MAHKHQFKDLDKSVRKQKIIDTAATLFHKKGYRSTTLDDVAKNLGISKAALYYYVKSKEEILTIIYSQIFEVIFRDTYEISDMALRADEKLRRIIRNHIKNIIVKNLAMFSVFFSEESQLPQKDSRKIREKKSKYTSILEKIIEEGISQGLFREVDPKLQAYGILGMCNWLYKWFKTDQSVYSPDEIADTFIALLEAGYLKVKTYKDKASSAVSVGTEGEARPGDRSKGNLKELRRQCEAMIAFIDEVK
ncbi:MAG: TetR family transcriptional regulator [Deltaproteobacteria bacterium]|nr:TetR family transcriptional regulator [Deltaproteobacteria bacterium]